MTNNQVLNATRTGIEATQTLQLGEPQDMKRMKYNDACNSGAKLVIALELLAFSVTCMENDVPSPGSSVF